MSLVAEASGITKIYRKGAAEIPVLRGVDICVENGDFIAIMGPSGSGKSTVLHILGCLDRPTSGSYFLKGEDMLKASDRELSRVRATSIGFVFQTFNLIPQLTVYENVEIPFLYSPHDDQRIRERVENAVAKVGLSRRMTHTPSELSGGEMQRAAIARALAVNPSFILADEPTGNLDSRTSEEILDVFRDLHQGGATILIVTHDPAVAARAERTMVLRDGRFQ